MAAPSGPSISSEGLDEEQLLALLRSTKRVRLTCAPRRGLFPSGESAYCFDFECELSEGRRLRLQARYSTVRAIYREARAADSPAFLSLPPFPKKQSFTRQTAAFLRERGTQLAAFLEALFTHPQLAALSSAIRLLYNAPVLLPLSPVTPPSKASMRRSRPPASCCDSAPSIQSRRSGSVPSYTPALRSFSHDTPVAETADASLASSSSSRPAPASLEPSTPPSPATSKPGEDSTSSTAARGATSFSSPLRYIVWPVLALLAAMAIGMARGHLPLALACCSLGLAVGIQWRWASAKDSSVVLHSSVLSSGAASADGGPDQATEDQRERRNMPNQATRGTQGRQAGASSEAQTRDAGEPSAQMAQAADMAQSTGRLQPGCRDRVAAGGVEEARPEVVGATDSGETAAQGATGEHDIVAGMCERTDQSASAHGVEGMGSSGAVSCGNGASDAAADGVCASGAGVVSVPAAACCSDDGISAAAGDSVEAASAVAAAHDALTLLWEHAPPPFTPLRGTPAPGGASAGALAVGRRYGEVWRPHSMRDGVDILTTDCFACARLGLSQLNGSLGVGGIAAPPLAVHEVMEGVETKRQIDKLWMMSTVLRDLDPSLIRIPGWRCERLTVLQERFRSPAIIVSPREGTVVRVVVKSEDGRAVAMAQQSIQLPHVPVPKGFVRMTVACGGYLAEATGRADASGGCRFTYINALEPGGYVPKAVVKTTLPDRAMTVAKVRAVVMAGRAAS